MIRHAFLSFYRHDDEQELTCEEALEWLEDNSCNDECDHVETVDNTDESTPLAMSYDMGWQRRSSGRKYNSLSCVGTMIGAKSKKIIQFGSRQKDCRTCTYHNNKKQAIPSHNCHKNFEGSSRAMEADLASELVKKIHNTGTAKLGTIIMDDDSTTVARIKSDFDKNIAKQSDIMHVKKHLTSSLYQLQKKNKTPTTDIIK